MSASIRVGDEDRAAASAILSDVLVSGHIDLATFEKRQSAISVATTRSELDDVFSDLQTVRPWNGQTNYKENSQKARRILGSRPFWGSYLLTNAIVVGGAAIILLIVWSNESLLVTFWLLVGFVLAANIALIISLVYLEKIIREAMDVLKENKISSIDQPDKTYYYYY